MLGDQVGMECPFARVVAVRVSERLAQACLYPSWGEGVYMTIFFTFINLQVPRRIRFLEREGG